VSDADHVVCVFGFSLSSAPMLSFASLLLYGCTMDTTLTACQSVPDCIKASVCFVWLPRQVLLLVMRQSVNSSNWPSCACMHASQLAPQAQQE
jgi:hypothetical protein